MKYKSSVEKLQSEILENNPGIKSVYVLYDHGVWSMSLRLEIIFHDGRCFMIDRVNKNQSGHIALHGIVLPKLNLPKKD
jgi:hypothetical protein